MHRVKIEFQKGGVFYARLLENEAPKTCKTIMNRLPFEYRFQQSIVSGHAVVCLPPDLTVEPENQRTIGIPAGALSFLVQDNPAMSPMRSTSPMGLISFRAVPTLKCSSR